MARSAIREHVFILLFESLFCTREAMAGQADNYFEHLDKPVDPESEAYIEDRFRGIVEKIGDIDSRIEEKSKGWKLNRIGKVELSILRLAVYEIIYDEEVPVSVAINEAVELAKKYGQEQAGSFVNGVLAKFTEEDPAKDR
ncbi:MAG: transcription antitermination factor NusB [Lachnospiraceae bacterium]|nr:transcription antitermination factor NusB [Lachnospiraceae bacterium]